MGKERKKTCGLKSRKPTLSKKRTDVTPLRQYTIPTTNLASNCMFKVNNKNTRTRCEICSKLKIKTPKRRQWRPSGVFIVNFEHISHFVLVFLLLNLSR